MHSDLVSDFCKGSKRGFKITIFLLIFLFLDAIKIFAGLSKLLYVFLLGTENIVDLVEIVVVVCGKMCGNMCGKMCGKIDFFWDWNKNLCGSRY